MEYLCLKSSNDKNVDEIVSSSLLIKKSKFISFVFNISNEIEAKKYIDDIKNKNKDARHIVYTYSYVIDGIKSLKYDEDSEPQGTATKAINDYLDRENLTNVCIIVVRYFGGILLGSGPLTRAYYNVALDAINKCEKTKLYFYKEYRISCKYDKFKDLNAILNKYIDKDIVKVMDTEFKDNIELNILIEVNNYSKVVEQIKGEKYYE